MMFGCWQMTSSSFVKGFVIGGRISSTTSEGRHNGLTKLLLAEVLLNALAKHRPISSPPVSSSAPAIH